MRRRTADWWAAVVGLAVVLSLPLLRAVWP